MQCKNCNKKLNIQNKTGYCSKRECRKKNPSIKWTKLQWYKKNKERINLERKNNPIWKQKRKEYYKKNKEKEKAYSLKYHFQNHEERLKKLRNNYWKNAEKRREASRIWIAKNKSRKLKYKKEYYHSILKYDYLYKLKRNIRYKIYKTLKIKGQKKDFKTIDELGFTMKDLKQHLENNFTKEMTWENYGTYWEIDHRVPLSLCKTKEQIIWANQLKNLIPATKKQNNAKRNFFIGNANTLNEKIIYL